MGRSFESPLQPGEWTCWPLWASLPRNRSSGSSFPRVSPLPRATAFASCLNVGSPVGWGIETPAPQKTTNWLFLWAFNKDLGKSIPAIFIPVSFPYWILTFHPVRWSPVRFAVWRLDLGRLGTLCWGLCHHLAHRREFPAKLGGVRWTLG